MVGLGELAGAIDGALADEKHSRLVRGLQEAFGIRHCMQTNAVDARFPAEPEPGIRVSPALHHESLVMPGIPLQEHGDSIEDELVLFQPHFAETEPHIE